MSVCLSVCLSVCVMVMYIHTMCNWAKPLPHYDSSTHSGSCMIRWVFITHPGQQPLQWSKDSHMYHTCVCMHVCNYVSFLAYWLNHWVWQWPPHSHHGVWQWHPQCVNVFLHSLNQDLCWQHYVLNQQEGRRARLLAGGGALESNRELDSNGALDSQGGIGFAGINPYQIICCSAIAIDISKSN